MPILLSTARRRAGLSVDILPLFSMSRSRRWRTTNIESRKEARAAIMEKQPDYKDWSHDKLIERVTELEKQLKSKTHRLVEAVL
jgi:hypothetical protein